MKRSFGKYGIIFLISFIPVICFNIFVGKYLGDQRWLIIFLDCTILLLFTAIGNAIAKKIFEKKDAKLAARIKEREALKAKKEHILEDSYKRKREEKAKAKLDKQKTEVVKTEENKIEKENDITGDAQSVEDSNNKVEADKPVKKTTKKGSKK